MYLAVSLFRPYVLKSTDQGASWASIGGDLPARDVVYSIQEDHVKPEGAR